MLPDNGYRTDRNNNPTAFTTQIAVNANLVSGVDYIQGDSFTVNNVVYYTAKLLHDPLAITIEVINKLGFYNKEGNNRWTYIAMPLWVWDQLTYDQKVKVIGFMYQHEGGIAMKSLFSPTVISVGIGDSLKLGDKVG